MSEDPARTIVSLLRIPVRAGSEEPFARAFEQLGVLEHAGRHDGFRGGRLLRPFEPGDPFVVMADWDGPEWYQRWLDDPIRAELTAGIADLVDGEMSVALYAGTAPERPA